MAEPVLIVSGVLALSAISAGIYYSANVVEEDKYNKRNLIKEGSHNRTLWLYYDQSDVNSRYWADFGARSSRVLSTPYLNLCYQSIVMKNGRTYNVKVLAGLSDVAVLLGGWNNLPKPLQNPIANVGEAELNYIRARILNKFGGLWVNPSTIFLKSLPDYSEYKKVVFFGTDKDETYADFNGTPVPGTNIMYSPAPNHPVFAYLEKVALARIEKQEGGRQFRSDIKWDLREVMKTNKDIEYLPECEFFRKENGRRIQLEDLLGTSIVSINPKACFIPLPNKELEERRNFEWFLRMSEEQILESDLYISKLFRL